MSENVDVVWDDDIPQGLDIENLDPSVTEGVTD